MSFRHKSSLSRHNKIHNKVTQCVFCKRSFRYESFLKKHMQIAHHEQTITIDYVIPKEETKVERDCMSVITYENDSSPQVIQVANASHYYQQPVAITISNANASFTS
jgi:hypothetical protein